jgi:hypothetical protein
MFKNSMISGVGRWPVRSEGGFARSRTCCVAVFCRKEEYRRDASEAASEIY